MKKIICILFVLVLAACSSAVTEVPTQTSAPTIEPTKTRWPTSTAGPTKTPIPTRTPRPTSSPKPTNTPTPTKPPTSTPEPVVLSGTGDSVVDLNWEGLGLLHITYTGSSNFVVKNYDSEGNNIDLLVNTIGSYEGIIPLDFLDGQDTARFEVKASGPWEIQVLPIGMIKHIDIPGTITGKGDDVVALANGDPDKLVIDASTAKSNFVIWAYGKERDLVVNEIAPYTGTVMVSKDVLLLVITAEGNWSIEVTVR